MTSTHAFSARLLPCLVLLCPLLLLRFFPSLALSLLCMLLVGVPIHLMARKTARLLHLPLKLCAVVYLILLPILPTLLLFPFLQRLLEELQALMQDPSALSAYLHRAEILLTKLFDSLPLFSPLPDTTGEALQDGLQRLLLSRAASLSQVLLSLMQTLPHRILTVVATVSGCVYVATDGTRLLKGLLSVFPPTLTGQLSRLSPTLSHTLRRYGRAYLFMLLITFLEVLVGLLLLGRRYALLTALLVALVDVLPVLGAGTVLLPWALLSFFSGEASLGCGLLILYGVITLVRQLLEPRLIGHGLGLHPLLTLYGMLLSLQLFGVLGMLLTPALLALAGALWKAPQSNE